MPARAGKRRFHPDWEIWHGCTGSLLNPSIPAGPFNTEGGFFCCCFFHLVCWWYFHTKDTPPPLERASQGSICPAVTLHRSCHWESLRFLRVAQAEGTYGSAQAFLGFMGATLEVWTKRSRPEGLRSLTRLAASSPRGGMPLKVTGPQSAPERIPLHGSPCPSSR